MGLTEIIESYGNGVTIAFASKNYFNEFFIDAKVHEDSNTSKINEIFEWEISKSRGKKYLIHSKKTSLGVTKFFRVLIGKDYIRFI